jgi:hypothetical protein
LATAELECQTSSSRHLLSYILQESIVACLLKARIVKPAETSAAPQTRPLLSNGKTNASLAACVLATQETSNIAVKQNNVLKKR